ncbi:MAG: hypothetical protein K1060chlam5_00239 [Candidatus Anoxychlamydiales bacterium]|nr:hypothetical protein [Candidatus Anoxychlamydiales bacterium]
MTYLRSFFLNILIVFFVLRIMPGIQIEFFENVPNIGIDIFFSLILGFLNSIIAPFLIALETKITNFKIAVLSTVITFLSFLIIAIFKIGIDINFLGFILSVIFVSLMSFFANYLELKHLLK